MDFSSLCLSLHLVQELEKLEVDRIEWIQQHLRQYTTLRHETDMFNQSVSLFVGGSKTCNTHADLQEVRVVVLYVLMCPPVLNIINEMLLDQIDASDSTVSTNQLPTTSLCPQVVEPVDKLLQNVDPAKDRELWVKENKTGEVRPVDMDI